MDSIVEAEDIVILTPYKLQADESRDKLKSIVRLNNVKVS